ncbi:MAG: PIN domain-containing protein [Bacteroidales bacterium]|nr:PIN domain-containing protein [Bacteroidales bacterium]
MTKLLIDTNIVLDLLARREPFYDCAAQVFSLADKHKVMLSVSSLSFATAYYILSKSLQPREVRDILRRLKILVSVFALDDKIVELALNDSAFEDFEDGLIYHTAIENSQDIIVTRNQKDFKKSKIPVMNADEYLVSIVG